MDPNTTHTWKSYLQVPKNRFEIILLSVGTVCILYSIREFLNWNENRPGLVLNDLLLKAIPSMDFSLITGILTNVLIFGGLAILIQKPVTLRLTLLSAIIISVLRITTMYLVPLDPPSGIIPLRDLLLENTFYCNKVMVRDLFFSGHTANIFLIGLLLQNKLHKYIVFGGAAIVASLLIIQHVHYTIDVLVAPVAALISFYLAKKILSTQN